MTVQHPPGSDANRFEQLVQSVTDYAIFLLDPAGIVTSWNVGAQRFNLYGADEIIGRHFSVFYTAEDRADGVPDRALRTAEREGRFEAENWRVRKDGGRIWASVVIYPVRDSQNALIGFAKITRDRTERHVAEEALRESEERFRLLVQSVTDYAIYMLDRTGIVSSWNPGARRAKGYEADEIVGQHFSRFYGEDDRARGLPQMALDTAAEIGRFEAEGWRYRKDGSRFWASVVIDPVRDEAGEVVGFAKVTRDLTERRETEAALEHARVALSHSQKMDALGHLTGGVAHDFNNLLAAILGSLDLAKRRLSQGQDATRYIDNAFRAAERGAALTQRMLAFARRQNLEFAPVDLVELVRGMADLLQASIGPGIAIRTSFPLVLRPVHADAGQLELAILNLVVNARDAMPNGGEILISAEEERAFGERPVASNAPPSSACIRLSVGDTGDGMDEETLARAMNPFFTTKAVGKGSGLGLSMVHGLADQCGGSLTLDSLLHHGTTATLRLPVASEPVVPAATTESDRAPLDVPESMLILAVDDDPLVLMITTDLLEEFGHRVIASNSGAEALERLRVEPIDLVVTDHAMPGMTGLQLAEAIRAQWTDLPIVLVSGYADIDCETPACVVRLGKPFTAEGLQRVLADAVHEAAPPPGAATLRLSAAGRYA